MQPELSKLLDAVCSGPLLPAAELPAVPAALRRAPRAGGEGGLFGDDDADDEEEQ
jgi:hypothetical protein